MNGACYGMADLEYRKLSDTEIDSELTRLPGWGLENGQIIKRYQFKTYKDGLVFGLAVGQVADQLNHHPDLEIGYARVRIAVNTHDVGGISPYDFELARRIENLIG